MFKLLIVSSLLMSGFATAKDIVALKITSDESSKITTFTLKVDENNIIQKIIKKSVLKGKTKIQEINPELPAEGIVLEERKGRKVIVLKGHNVTAQYGGLIEIDYLYNGITGSRSKLELDLEPTSNSWQFTINNKPVKHLYVVTNKKMFRTVGVKRIKVLE
jgi:hypothetical protein